MLPGISAPTRDGQPEPVETNGLFDELAGFIDQSGQGTRLTDAIERVTGCISSPPL